ncbi:hypothetical protein CK203_044012 [Vitis vinifera]|uniref:Uncharacterized protein n=1 Tax=Vitis vinifera TaxID=29760 RepID=A0A438HTI1_VITVI|nr:hypothetical protein CK203_044012 [Vitis vinifera]
MLQVWGKGTMPLNVPQRKKERKPCKSLGVTESCQSSEKESNASEECTNFTAFMASVIDEPLKKEVLVSLVSQVTNGDEMSFDSAYETLYKECLSLKRNKLSGSF